MWLLRTGVFVGIATSLAVTLALAQTPAAPAQGDTIVTQTQAAATVTKIDQTTRELTLKTQDGREVSFIVDPAVKNLPQVKVGDKVVATYTEALAYEVKKGGTAGTSGTAGAATAKPGAMPAAVVGRQVTVTVVITAIDPTTPSVTFKGPEGNTRTIKVQRPERLQGVSVGDSVELTYTEALAVKVDPAPK